MTPERIKELRELGRQGSWAEVLAFEECLNDIEALRKEIEALKKHWPHGDGCATTVCRNPDCKPYCIDSDRDNCPACGRVGVCDCHRDAEIAEALAGVEPNTTEDPDGP